MADQSFSSLFHEGVNNFNLTSLQATFFAQLTLAVTDPNPQVSRALVNTYMNNMYSNPRLTAPQIQQILDAVEQKTKIRIPDPLGRPRSSVEDLLLAETEDAPASMNDLEGARPRSAMTDEEIQAAAKASFHLGAGWGGYSFTNEGGIATIDSSGRISWSGFGGLGQTGQSQFTSGKDALNALANFFGLGREDSAPPSPPSPPSPPDDGGSGAP